MKQELRNAVVASYRAAVRFGRPNERIEYTDASALGWMLSDGASISEVRKRLLRLSELVEQIVEEEDADMPTSVRAYQKAVRDQHDELRAVRSER